MIKTNSNCFILTKIQNMSALLIICLPVLILSIIRFVFVKPYGVLLPSFFWGVLILLSSIGLFYSLTGVRYIYYLWMIARQIDISGSDILSVTDLQHIFHCNERKAKNIASALFDGGYFLNLYYDSDAGILVFTKNRAEEYCSLVFSSDGRRLSKKEIRSREDIVRIQSSAGELKKAIDGFVVKYPNDKRAKKTMNDVHGVLCMIPRAMAFNMANNADLHKIYTYYVPNLCNVINDYCLLSDVSVADMRSLHDGLMSTLSQYYQAFSRICTSINENDELDLSVEMSTIRAVMSSDGWCPSESDSVGEVGLDVR